MKKKLLVLLLTTLTLSCTACNSEKKEIAEFEKNYGKVTLCDYKNLDVEKPLFIVTDDNVADSIENLLYGYAETKEVNRPSKENDILVLTMTAKKGTETYIEYKDDEPYNFYLGYQEFGTEFDQKLTGVSAGDDLQFSITYAEDFDIPDFAGATIDFTVHIIQVNEEQIPELTDTFIKDTLHYDSMEALEQGIRKQLEDENITGSISEMREDILRKIISNSTFESYSNELYEKYDAAIEESYLSYAQMFGFETLDEIYDAFGMSAEDVEKEVLNAVYRNIAVEAIARKENISISDEEFESKQTALLEEYGYESLDDLHNDYGDEESLKTHFLEEEVLDFLEKHVTIIEVEAPIDDNADSEELTDAE